jgi:mannose-6-phosphate isomerase-like protein (cupin superfamily)
MGGRPRIVAQSTWFGIREHDERKSGQEEIYVPVAGSGHIVVDGETVALEPGAFVLVEPESTRQVVAGTGGLTYVIVGAVVQTAG